MICWVRRHFSWARGLLVMIVCIGMIGIVAARPAAWPEDDGPALTGPSATSPLLAIAEGSSPRLQKQAQIKRLSLHKPQLGARFSSSEYARIVQPRPQIRHQRSSILPRRLLSVRHLVPRGPDESGDPFLS
jgi:hypothetical protein